MAARRKESARHPRPLKDIPGLTTRPAWQGHLRLSLVSCAVGLFRATTTTGDVSFNLINPETGNRIKMVPTDPDEGPVERASLVKGYPMGDDKHVLFSDEELKSVKLETTRTLDIERFVDADTIDRLYWDEPYILVPADESAAEAYGVIQQAMAKANRIALGRVVMHTRERLLAIEPRETGLVATTLRMRDEVVNLSKALGAIPRGRTDKQMIEIAERIIEQQEGAFDPEEFTDRYEGALRDLIEEKKRGRKITRSEPKEQGNVVDLMEALKRSLTKSGSKSGAKAGAGRGGGSVSKMPKRRAARH